MIITTQSSSAWIASLGDSGIRSDLQTFAAGGSLSYASALQLLNDVAARGAVSAQEFADLQTIAGHLDTQSGISSTGYVASLFYQLADGSQANATWNGGSATAVSLGNLAAGTTQSQMQELIGKWFLGTDLPDPTTTGASASNIINPTYQSFSYTLFGPTGTPQIVDISQGDLGDCELCAGLIETIQNNPALIKSMIVDDGNGSYGVRFYVNGKETWVTVNNELPVYQGGLIFNNAYAPAQSVGFWADLVEKAYAELSADGNIGHPSVNSYNNVSADAAFNVLTNLTNASEVLYFMATAANFASYKTAIIDAINQHDDVEIETDPNAANVTDAAGKETLVGDHAYAVVGYDSATGDFIVRNPWGVERGTQNYETQFEVSMADVVKVNGDFVVDNIGAINVVITNAGSVAALAQTTNSSFYPSTPQLATNAAVQIAPLLQVSDAAGLAVSQYRLQLLGGIGTINLNGATNLATSAQQANGQIVVSAADFSKLTLATGTAAGTVDMLIAGNDGSGWGLPSEFQWKVAAGPASLLPSVDSIVTASGSLSVSSLFLLNGGTADSYYVQIESGGGTLNLNGATDLLSGGAGGQIKVSAADLAKLTYTASANSGVAILDVTASVGGVSTALAQVPVDVGYTVASALKTFDQGQTPFQVAVADTAANIFSNLDHLEQMVPNWNLLGVKVTDATPQTESISYGQFENDQGVLSLLQGNYALNVTGAPVAQLSSVQGQSHVASVGISVSSAYVLANIASLQSQISTRQISELDVYDDPSKPAQTLTVALTQADATAVNATAGYKWTVTDSSANVQASLDSLQSLTAAGKIGTITLTDAASSPTLTVTSAQYTADSAALQDLAFYPVIDVTVSASTQNISGLSGHAVVAVFSGTESQYTIGPSITGLSGVTVTGNGTVTSVHNVTALQFANGTAFIASQTPATAGAVTSAQVANLYAAVFARTPDSAGLNYYEVQAANNPGLQITNFAQSFLASPEYVNNTAHTYAQTTAGDTQFIDDTYSNLLHRAPESGAVPYYLNVISGFTNGLTPGTAAYTQAELLAHATVLAGFSQSAEFIGDVQITSAHPADSQHWLILV